MSEYNCINTIIHYFSRDKKRIIDSFSVWVSFAGEVVKAPDKHKQLIGQSIEAVSEKLRKRGYEHHVIN